MDLTRPAAPPRTARRASVALVLVLCLAVILGFLAMSLEWSAVPSIKAELQVAADAAAVAAASALPDGDEALVLAQAYASRVSVRGRALELDAEDLVFGTWDADSSTFTEVEASSADAVKVTVRYGLNMPLSTLFGVSALPLHAVAGGGATAGGPAPDLVIVQDVTSSFSAEIGQARAADYALVNCVYDRASGETKVGLVAFTGFETNLLSPDELVTYEEDYSAVVSKIASVKVCGSSGMPACSGTNIAAGLYMALNILDDSDSDEEVGRAAVLVSDGAPNADSAVCKKSRGAYKSDAAAYFCPGWSNSPTDKKLEDSAKDIRDEFEAAGYDLYTVFYNETNDSTQSHFMDDLTAGDGIYLESPDPDDIGDMLEDVCMAYVRQKPGLIF